MAYLIFGTRFRVANPPGALADIHPQQREDAAADRNAPNRAQEAVCD